MELRIPLNIPDVEIISFEQMGKGDYVIAVRSTLQETRCNRCGKKIMKFHGYDDAITLRHLPILDRRVYIQIKPARYYCQDCDQTTTQRLKWYDPRSQYTKAYEDYLMRLLINSTIQDVCMKESTSYKGVQNVLRRKIGTKVDWSSYQKLETIGIDEIALRKGHQDFVAIVSARIDGNVHILGVLPDRKKATVKAFLEGIPAPLAKTVKSVCCDMYDGFTNAAKEVFGSKMEITIDRFHVAKQYRKAVDALRKSELKRLRKVLDESEYKQLKGAMWALRKDPESLKAEEQTTLEVLFKHAPLLQEAYQFQKDLSAIFNDPVSAKVASKKIKSWIKGVRKSELKCFDTFIKTLEEQWDYILNYFHGRRNSGFVEGLNNKIKVIKRRCYGIFDTKSLFQRIYLDLNGYALCA